MMKLNFSSLTWKINRLFSMSFTEILYKISIEIRKKVFFKQKFNLFKIDSTCTLKYFFEYKDDSFDKSLLTILPDGNFYNLYGKKIQVDSLQWNYDYITETSYPMDHISKIKLHDYSNKEVKNIL